LIPYPKKIPEKIPSVLIGLEIVLAVSGSITHRRLLKEVKQNINLESSQSTYHNRSGIYLLVKTVLNLITRV
jgi:hypothetical protein